MPSIGHLAKLADYVAIVRALRASKRPVTPKALRASVRMHPARIDYVLRWLLKHGFVARHEIGRRRNSRFESGFMVFWAWMLAEPITDQELEARVTALTVDNSVPHARHYDAAALTRAWHGIAA